MRLSLRGDHEEMGRRSGSRARRRKVMLSRGGIKALATALVALGLCQALFSHGVLSQAVDENTGGAIGTEPKECGTSEGGVKAYCSRCENTTALLEDSTADPSWITFSQVFAQANTPADLSSMDGQPITFVNGQAYEANQYHYFEFMVKGGDGLIADDIRRDAVYLSLVSPASIRVSTGEVVVVSEDAAKKPAYDFYVGQNCVPQEGAWNNQGYGNVNADEKMKSIYVNVTRDARYFIALQSRKIRYGVAAFDFTMKLSRGSLVSKHPTTSCTQLVYRYPDEIAQMTNEFRQTGDIGMQPGGAIPFCGATPAEKKYNIRYIYPTPAPGLSQRDIAIVVGGVGGGVVLCALLAGAHLWIRYKRTTQRMAKFSSLSRGLPDALLDGEGQEVAV